MKKSKNRLLNKIIIISITIIIAILLLTYNLVSANTIKLEAKVSSTTTQIEDKQELTITFRLDKYNEIDKGINAYKATLEYDKNIFEEVTEKNFTSQNDWEQLKYNKETGEFVAIKKVGSITPEDIVKINFKAKNELKAGKTEIKITDVVSSEGKADIQINEAKVEVDIMEDQEEIPDNPEKPDKSDKITSEKYKIEEEYIAKILPETTIKKFKENVTTDNEMTFIDTEGNIMEDNDIISTGVKIKVGKTLQYTLIVIGDIDQDTKITINDLAKLKLHLIETELLAGIELKAAYIDDDDNEVTINDLAQLKLILIGLLNLQSE